MAQKPDPVGRSFEAWGLQQSPHRNLRELPMENQCIFSVDDFKQKTLIRDIGSIFYAMCIFRTDRNAVMVERIWAICGIKLHFRN